MTRLSLLVACLFASTALCSCASEARSDTKTDVQDSQKSPAADIDGGVRQAQLLRLAGHYDEAIHTLSQMMLVASDDARVVGEYGKTLAQMGRAKEASQFLTRALELSPRDWTLYSALGVAYDESGDADKASGAYQQALLLKPEEPSVLSNFALSRLMAADVKGAAALAARADHAGGSSDAKIARNLAMIESLAGKGDGAAKPAPVAVATALRAAPVTPVQNAPLPPQPVVAQKSPAPFVSVPQSRIAPGAVAQRGPTAPPRALAPIEAAPGLKTPQPRGVVMQRVPVDPLAGPVKPKPAPKVAQQPAPKNEAAKAVAEIARDSKSAKAAPPKPDAKTAKAEPAKPSPKQPDSKAANAKPARAPVKAAKDTAPKDSVPALRMTAAAY